MSSTIKKYGKGLGQGWHYESAPHGLCARGIKLGRLKPDYAHKGWEEVDIGAELEEEGSKEIEKRMKEGKGTLTVISPQTTLKNAKVLKKIGNWTIEVFDNPSGHRELVVTNGWNTYYPIIYSHNLKVAWDNPYPVPESIHKYFNLNREKLLKIQEKKVSSSKIGWQDCSCGLN